ncbi:MAG TPA: glycoside hydrolase family 18 protein [Pseudonocardiaceae bacterium]|nr:glycoside hydrolase family 18 protein [Pseudonocardiaceae bacterium]
MRINRLISAAVVALLAGGGTVLLAGLGSAAGANLVSNSGFESGATSGWSCSSSPAGVVTSPVHSGTYALSATPAGQDDAQCTQTVSVQPNSAYSLSAWVEGDYVYLGASGTGSTDVSTWTPAASSWTQLTTSFTTGAATTSVSVYLHGWYGQPTYYADDVSLTGPGGSAQAPAAPTGLKVGTVTSSSVALSWTAPTGSVTGYNVYVNGTKKASSTGTSATISGLAAATAYTFAVTATNAAGESSPSGNVSATTSAASTGGGGGTGNSGLPAHILTGYWQDFTNGAEALRLSAVPTTYDVVAVAFANADPSKPGGVTFSIDSGLSSALGGYTASQFTSDIATLHSRGQKVIISVGGQNGTISVSDSTSAANFASSVNALISQYGFDGVDIDLENGVNPTYMAQALHSIASAHPGAIITLAPQTIDMQSTGMAYFQLALAIKDVLTIVNTQYYNSGTMNGCDGNVYAEATENFLTALACIQLQGGLSASQVGLGLPASSPAGAGFQSAANVNAALDCLAGGTNCGSFKPSTTYPAIGGAMDWSINWDASNGYAFANTVHPHLATLP